jgi:hypothetical protein
MCKARRSACLMALAVLALVLPATASAAGRPDYRILVFTPRDGDATPVSGSHALYLVFRSVDGGPTTGFGNLNWVGFSGPGIGVNP